MNLLKKIFICNGIIVLISSYTFAKDDVSRNNKDHGQQKTEKSVKNEAKKEARRFLLVPSLTFFRNAYSDDSRRAYAASTISLSAVYKVTKTSILSTSFVYEKQLNKTRNEKFSDSSIGYGDLIKTFDNGLALTGSVSAIIPYDKDKRKMTSLITGVAVKPTLEYGFKSLGIEGLKAKYSALFLRSFYHYETMSTGQSNTQYQLTNRFQVNYSFLENFGAEVSFANTNKWSFKGNRRGDTYSMGQSVSMGLNKNMAITLGHEIGGSTFKYNGVDSNIDFYNKDKSIFYMNIGLQF